MADDGLEDKLLWQMTIIRRRRWKCSAVLIWQIMANNDGDEYAEWAESAEYAEGTDAVDGSGYDADGDDGADNYDDGECDDAAGDENGARKCCW